MEEAPRTFLQDRGHGRRGHKWDFFKGKNGQPLNNRPIIGVLTQPLTEAFKKDPRFANKTSYIMASYINILESAGARTVPLIFDGDLQTELKKLDYLNGVFYCGGGAEGPYDVFGKAVFEKAKQMNDNG